MNETNKKVLVSTIAATTISLFAGWLMFSPSPVKVPPSVKRINKGDASYYIVTIEGEEWVTKYGDGSPGMNWQNTFINLKTGEACYSGQGVFGLDSGKLSKIVNKWRDRKNNKNLVNTVNRLKNE